MKNREKLWKKIKQSEKELLASTPQEAARLVRKIVKWKGQVFDD